MVKPHNVTKPRKSPSQSRSRATVDAIMQASTYILSEVGWSGLNTNAIAERAGVNISSLYQYFPNKQAIIAELQRRHATSIHAEIQNILVRMGEQPTLKEALSLIIEMVIAEHRSAPELHKVISEELPQSQRCAPEMHKELLVQALNTLQPFMKNVPNTELATFIVGVSLQAIVHQVTNQRPSLLNQQILVDEMVALVGANRENGKNRALSLVTDS